MELAESAHVVAFEQIKAAKLSKSSVTKIPDSLYAQFCCDTLVQCLGLNAHKHPA